MVSVPSPLSPSLPCTLIWLLPLATSLGAAKNQGLFHGLCYVWLPHTLPCSGSVWPAVFSSCTLASLLGLIPFLPGK